MNAQEKLLKSLPRRIRRGRPKKPAFLAVDYYCGGGGTTRGLIDAGGYVITGLDKQEECRPTYVSNNGNETGDRNYPEFLALDLFPATEEYPTGQQQDAINLLGSLIAKHRSRYPEIPLLFAICAPCQPFTKLSKSVMSDDRVAKRQRDSALLPHTVRFVEHYNPDLVLSENVSGITDARYSGVWEEFAERLRNLNYMVETRRVCASKFGIPQHRKRSILVGVKKTTEFNDFSFELPEGDYASTTITVAEALGGLPPLEAGQKHQSIPNHIARGLSELNKKRISYAAPGQSNEYLASTPEGDLSLKCHVRVNKKFKQRCFSDVYTRMAAGRPSPTITTRCHSITNGRFGHHDPNQLRGISMREAARLQSFRDEYIFYPQKLVDPVARMIGNAVPPKLVMFYALWLLETLTILKSRETSVGGDT